MISFFLWFVSFPSFFVLFCLIVEGVLVWEIVTRGGVPYDGMELMDVYSFVREGNTLEVPEDAQEILKKLVSQRCVILHITAMMMKMRMMKMMERHFSLFLSFSLLFPVPSLLPLLGSCFFF